jgi:transposase
MRPQGTTAELERRRLRAIELLKAGHGPKKVAEMLGVSRQAVYNWRVAYADNGRAGLAGRPNSGPPPKLSEKQRRELVKLLKQGARKAGFETELWTGPRVVAVIRRRFRVDYHRCHVTRLLRMLGFSPQKPAIRPREQDPHAADRWRREDWPRIKKGRPRTS